MKKLILLLLTVCSTLLTQGQNIAPAPADKAVVYFVRYNGMGALINFTYFDGDKVIGRFNAPKYLRYECEPGAHSFWARSENKSFIEAELEAGKIYVVDVMPQMGAFKASVKLRPVSPGAVPRGLQRLLSKKAPESFTAADLKKLQANMKDVLERGNAKKDKLEENGKDLAQLTTDMAIDPKELVFVKKKKKK